MTPVMFRPGLEVKEYEIYRKKAVLDEKGKVSYRPVEEGAIGVLRGAIARTTQREAEKWKQSGYAATYAIGGAKRWKQITCPATYTVIVRGRTIAEAEDVLVRDGARYYIEGKFESGGLGIFTVLYCNRDEGA